MTTSLHIQIGHTANTGKSTNAKISTITGDKEPKNSCWWGQGILGGGRVVVGQCSGRENCFSV